MAAWHSMEAAQALQELDTDLASGLTEDEARRRLLRYSYNELAKKEQRISPLTIFIDQFKNILIAVLLVAAVLSAVISEWMGAVLILVIVVFCAALGFAQEYRAGRALEALKNMLSPTTTVLRRSSGKAVVTSTGTNTEFGEIAEAVTAVKAETTHLAKRMAEIGKWLGIICLAVCFLVLVISILRQIVEGSTTDLPFVVMMVMFAVALAMAAVPEALPAIVTGALAVGMRQMAKRNALGRKISAVETLGCVTVICSDKTGMLTKGEMTVRKIFSAGRMVEVSRVGYAPVGELRGSGVIKPNDEFVPKVVLSCGNLMQ